MVFLSGLLILVLAASSSLSDEELLREAESAFRQGVDLREQPDQARSAFRRAAECYEQLRQRGAMNTALLRNEGNAFLLSGDLPHAILAYRRGSALDPEDRGLRRQLEVARELAYAGMAPVVHPPVENWPPLLPRPPLRYRWFLAAGILALAWVAFARWRMTHNGALLASGVFALLVGLTVMASTALEGWRLEEERVHPLVVIARDRTILRRGDGPEYPAREQVPPLNAGVEGRLLIRRHARDQEWLQIELAGGEVGWLRAGQVLVEEP